MATDEEPVTDSEREPSWRPESAGEHVTARVPSARDDEQVGAVAARIFEQGFDSLEAVFVVDANGRFLGAVRLPDLQRSQHARMMGEIMDRGYPRVGVHHDQEHVAAEAFLRRATSVAVVDDAERLLGAVPALSLLDILRREHVEDLHRLAGIRREAAREMSALEAPPMRRARHRLPWLLVGLVGSMLSALIMARFEHVLETRLTVTFFVPAIVYLADAIGTQTEAIVVRGLSLSRLSLRHLLFGELRTGLVIGVVLALLALPVIALAFGDVRLGIAVAVSIVSAGGMATTIGLLFPWWLQRMGTDPAFGSGPVATIIQDVLSLLIYFAIVTVIVR